VPDVGCFADVLERVGPEEEECRRAREPSRRPLARAFAPGTPHRVGGTLAEELAVVGGKLAHVPEAEALGDPANLLETGAGRLERFVDEAQAARAEERTLAQAEKEQGGGQGSADTRER
jgi:hypothetical protein